MKKLMLMTSMIFSLSACADASEQVKTFRLSLGDYQITALYDGVANIQATSMKAAFGDQGNLAVLMQEHFAGPAREVPIIVYIIATGLQTIMIDAGLNGMWGSSSGYLVPALRQAGYNPEEIDAILITHAHPDHIAGLVNAQHEKTFPNAQIYIAQKEYDFWTSATEEAAANEDNRPCFELTRQIFVPYLRDGCVYKFVENEQLFSGIRVVPLQGHTPGHSGFLCESAGQKIFFTGDAIHTHDIQFAQPSIGLTFDIDFQHALSVRQRLLADSASDNLLLAAAHLPFPGMGYVRVLSADERSYVWEPFIPS